jgi:predicted permease
LQRVDSGVRTDGVLAVRVMPRPGGYVGIDNAVYYPDLLRRVSELPGVRSVGAARFFPWVGVELPGQPVGFVGAPPGDHRALLETVSPGFAETMEVPLLAGRRFTWDDGANRPQVALVNQRLARLLSPDGDVVGRRVWIGSDPLHADATIVGVVGNTTLGYLRQVAPPLLYRPALQSARLGNYPHLLVAVEGDAAAVSAGIRRVLDEGGREYAHEISAVSAVLARAPGNERIGASLSSMLAALALVLTFMGLYSVLAYAVVRRTRELGVRLAVGATPASLVRLVLREGLMVTLAGLLIGIPAALAMTRLLRALLFGISDTDLVTFAVAATILVIVGTTAGLWPAWRAARVDPAKALQVP